MHIQTNSRRGRHERPAHAHRPGHDLAVSYKQDIAIFRPVTKRGRNFLATFRGLRVFAHGAAIILSRSAARQGLRVRLIGEPCLRSVSETETILRLEVAA